MTDADQDKSYHADVKDDSTYEERNSNMKMSESSTIISQRSTTATAVTNDDGNCRRQERGFGYEVKITDLPEEVIMKLEELIPVDYISLMHVNSAFFAMKGRFYYYEFKKSYSCQYYTSQAFRDTLLTHRYAGDISMYSLFSLSFNCSDDNSSTRNKSFVISFSPLESKSLSIANVSPQACDMRLTF